MNFKSLILISILTIFCSCSNNYVQVFEVSTENKTIKNETSYIYENDSIKITYNFWDKNGIMSFAILNKLKKPLYINWNKSSYITNTIKLNYWEDISVTNSTEGKLSISQDKTYNDGFNTKKYNVAKSVGLSSSITSKPEKTTFIPPNANYFRIQFNLFPDKELYLRNYKKIEVSKLNNKSKKEVCLEKNISRNESPLVFRNFITMSYNENFTSEFYVDNEFFISKVTKLKYKLFERIKRKENSSFYDLGEDGKIVMDNPFKNRKSFYIIIPQ